MLVINDIVHLLILEEPQDQTTVGDYQSNFYSR